MRKIVLAGGCFWGVEEFFSRIPGVIETEVGYANGNTENPTYEEVCTKNTGFAESVAVTYDNGELTLKYILEEFWSIVDPTSLNKQGGDIGTQYRTGIYYSEEGDLPVIIRSKEDEQNKYLKPIVTEIEPLKNFYSGEEYHQKYLKKNPGGYCHIKFD